MTVGETISSPSIVPPPQAAPQIQMAQQPHPPLDQVNATGVLQNPSVQVMAHEAVPNTGIVRSNSNSHHPSAHPMATKVNQEILTSLHFIKDIRRLEKYQRDFFLKVKESLTHVHVLLDHQLMDMAWSDNLVDCEENLLKCSTCVQNSSASQLVDAYNILLHDRERLNNRFQELSVKSSLSEFVVNSRQLLDINAVRVAAEAILKGENPIPAQGDNTVPVDHTFFLGNFCTTSLASSMMASFVPKPASINTQQGPNKGMITGSVGEDSILASTNYTQSPGAPAVQQSSMYDNSPRGINSSDKKLNGSLVTSPAIAGNQQVQQQIQQVQGRPQNMLSGNSGSSNSNPGGNVVPPNNISNAAVEPVSPEVLPGSGARGHPSGSVANPTTDGMQTNQTTSPHTNTNGIDYSMGGNSIPPSAQDFNSSKGGSAQTETGTSSNLTNIYDTAGGLDKFLLTAAAAKDGTAAERAAVVAAAEMAVSNGMYGHELVTAISQITNQSGTTTSRNANVKSKSPQKPQLDPWGKIANSNDEDTLGQPAANDASSANTNAEGRGYNRSSNASNRSQNSKGNVNPPPAGAGNSNSSTAELNLPNDNASDSVSTASDEGSRGGQTVTAGPGVGDLGAKPLSFARIASLGLEKQAIHRPNVNNQLAAVAAAQALGAGVGGSFPPNLSTLQMVNALGGDVNSHQTNPGSMATVSAALPQPALHMTHASGVSIATSLPGNMSMGQGSNNGTGQQNMGPVSSNVSGNGPMGQALHFSNNQTQYPLHHQAQTNTAVGQLQHVGGGGMINHPGGGSHLQQQQQQASTTLMHSLPPTSNPRFYFDISMEGKRLGRVIIEVQPSIAPKMSQNFQQLVTGERGFGYKGCHFFQAWRNESVICGDWEHNSGRGGRAAIEGGPLFTPDDTRLPCIRGAVGMRRMSKKHSSLNQVASQFRIILANMNTQFTGIFGHVVSGIEALDKVADMGGDGGRPEKTAMVSACGMFKS